MEATSLPYTQIQELRYELDRLLVLDIDVRLGKITEVDAALAGICIVWAFVAERRAERTQPPKLPRTYGAMIKKRFLCRQIETERPECPQRVLTIIQPQSSRCDAPLLCKVTAPNVDAEKLHPVLSSHSLLRK